MKLSPIQLLDYQVTSLNVEACASFNRDQPIDLNPADVEVSALTKRLDHADEPRWAVTLSLRLEPVEEKNIPYRLSIDMVGLVTAIAQNVDETIRHAVEVNGPSMLFGAAREILRDATARGPHGPILIPSASFFTAPPSAAMPATKPKSPARKSSRIKK
jgi:preprotein translocase subunit SecB